MARCSDGSLYTGYTVDVPKREQRHNAGTGAKYTRHRRPVQIVYVEEYTTTADALRREREIKSWSKKQKEHLIRSRTAPIWVG